jgi:hypothetical protein
MSPIGNATQRPPLYPHLQTGSGGDGCGSIGYDRQQPQFYRPPESHHGAIKSGVGNMRELGLDSSQHYQYGSHQQHQVTANHEFYAAQPRNDTGIGSHAYDSDAGSENRRASYTPEDEFIDSSASELLDQAIDDIFSFARHNRVEEVMNIFPLRATISYMYP